MRMNIVGAGRVGKVLGRELFRHGLVEVQGILNRTEESARLASSKIGSGHAVKSKSDFGFADLWMFAVSDDALPRMIKEFEGTDFSSSIIFHCSGAFPSSIFVPLSARGVASVHPVMTFADSAVEDLKGVSFTIEGDRFAKDQLSRLLTKIGGETVEIPADKKLLYHSAMVMVSNYLTSLVYAGQELLVESGFSQEQALKLVAPLAKEALTNNLSIGPVKALTGPIQRGDIETVRSELEILSQNRFLAVYAVMGRVALEIASKAGLKPEAKEQLSELLSGDS